MKYVRFSDNSPLPRYGVLEGDTVREIEGEIFGDHTITDKSYKRDGVKILPPCEPSKIVAVGLNYRDHAEEMGRELPEEPRIFLKPHTAVIADGEKIKYPDHMSERVDFEGELGVVIGEKATHVREAEALDYVFGYTCMNDVTARDLQAKDIQFTRAKGFDTFAPTGPVIETELDPGNLQISTYLNGELKQDSNTSRLIFGVPHLVSFISQVMTLLPGDIISTGTPEGVAPMKKGDKVEVAVEGIGTLTNYVE
jgi:2-keto-4-pentenoate hydratase/2-oxohepta-3-ene-1,7-dioic acid hydratase in catechol pathway